MTLSFLLTSLIVVASPGTGVLYTLAVALTSGARPSIAAAFGCTLGIVPHMMAAMLGLAAVLHTSAVAFAALKWCGVAYLLYMAWQALRETGALSIDTRPATSARSSRRVIVTAILINILNPKLSIFFLAFLPQFVSSGTLHATYGFLLLGLTFVATGTVWVLVLAVAASSVRGFLKRRRAAQAWLSRTGGVFVYLGVRLAMADR